MRMENIFTAIPSVISIFKKYLGNEIFLIFSLAAIAGLLDGLGIMLALPILESAADNSAESQISLFLLGAYQFFGVSPTITNLLLGMVLIFFLKGAALYLSLERVAIFRGRLLIIFKSKLISRYKNMSASYYSEKDAGYFTNIVNEQVNRSLQAFLSICQLISNFVNSVIYLVLAFLVAWSFGVMALLLGVGLLMLFRTLNRLLSRVSHQNSEEAAFLTSRMVEFLQGFKYFKATNRFDSVLSIISSSVSRLSHYEVINGRAAAFTQSVREPIAVVFIAVVMIVQIVFFDQAIEPILISVLLFYRCLNSVVQVQGYWQNTLEFSGGLRVVNSELERLAGCGSEATGTKFVDDFQSLEFRDFSFSYSASGIEVLNSISIRVEQGESYALVGRSGSGKSTLLEAVCLLNRAQSGDLFINGVASSRLDVESWRKQIGYVPQFPLIVEGTILDNVLMGEVFDPDKVSASLKAAGLLEEVELFDSGLQTNVGERGMSLSGGQRQRLAIARELYAGSRLLILDEATSALDPASESAIVNTIRGLRGKVCLLVAAHRLSTVKAVESVFVLEKGTLVESGEVNGLINDLESKFGLLLRENELEEGGT